MPHEGFTIKRDEVCKPIEIMIQQFLAHMWRQISLGIVQKRSDVVLQGALAASLIVQEKRLAVAQYDVAGLKVAVEEVLVFSGEQELRQTAEIPLQGRSLIGIPARRKN